MTETERVMAARRVVEQTKVSPKNGGDWEKLEEPALRPYKAFCRGVGAIGYQSLRSFAEGNEKLPVLGSVEIFRGMRRGSVEFVEGTYMAMAGTPARGYREIGRTNRAIENEPFVSTAVDVATCAAVGFTGYSGTETAALATAGLFAAQTATDHSPVDPRYDEKRYERQVSKAQREYIGDRAATNAKTGDRGNLLKKYRD